MAAPLTRRAPRGGGGGDLSPRGAMVMFILLTSVGGGVMVFSMWLAGVWDHTPKIPVIIRAANATNNQIIVTIATTSRWNDGTLGADVFYDPGLHVLLRVEWPTTPMIASWYAPNSTATDANIETIKIYSAEPAIETKISTLNLVYDTVVRTIYDRQLRFQANVPRCATKFMDPSEALDSFYLVTSVECLLQSLQLHIEVALHPIPNVHIEELALNIGHDKWHIRQQFIALVDHLEPPAPPDPVQTLQTLRPRYLE